MAKESSCKREFRLPQPCFVSPPGISYRVAVDADENRGGCFKRGYLGNDPSAAHGLHPPITVEHVVLSSWGLLMLMGYAMKESLAA
eukprot:1392777-Amorphochlora_amoeboformis.AAC.1